MKTVTTVSHVLYALDVWISVNRIQCWF